MGMASWFEDEELIVTDREGLIAFLDRFYEKFPDYWCKRSELFEHECITFSNWTDIKLIIYWKPIDCVFLQGVAKYIDGYAKWSFENEDEVAKVEFKDGKCIIHTGTMKWTKDSSVKMFSLGAGIIGKTPEIKRMKDFITMEAI